MKTIKILLIILSSFQLNGFSQSNIYEYSEFNRYLMNTKMTLKFERDTFRYSLYSKSCTGGNTYIKSIGTYKQEGKRIELTTLYSKENTYTYKDSIVEEFYLEISEKNKEVYELLELDSVVLLLKLDSIFFARAPAMWSTNDYMYLISRINQTGRTGVSRMWSNCKKENLFTLDKSLKKYLPREWKDYILENPIEASIIDSVSIKSENVHIQYIVTINQGEIHGLEYGIRLYCEESQIRIFEVNRETSKGYLHCAPYKINYFLSSQNRYSSRNKRLLMMRK